MTMTEQDNKAAWQHEAPAIDVEAEWQRFCAEHPQVKGHSQPVRALPPGSPRRGWHRWAVAASMLLLCTLGLALGWGYLRKAPSVRTPEAATMPQPVLASDSIVDDDTRLTFRDASLQTILQEVAARHGAQLRYRGGEEVRLYVELEKSWSLQECVDFLNHFERVNLKLVQGNIIVAE